MPADAFLTTEYDLDHDKVYLSHRFASFLTPICSASFPIKIQAIPYQSRPSLYQRSLFQALYRI